MRYLKRANREVDRDKHDPPKESAPSDNAAAPGHSPGASHIDEVSAAPKRRREHLVRYGMLWMSLLALLVPMMLWVWTQGLTNYRRWIDGVVTGDEVAVLIAGLAAGYLYLALLTWTHVTRADKDDRAREESARDARQLQELVRDSMMDVRRTASRSQEDSAWVRKLMCGSTNVRLLLDEDPLWKYPVGAFTAVHSTFLREVNVKRYHDGTWGFEATDRARNILDRLSANSDTSVYNVVLYVPPVEKVFESYAGLPIKKLIFLCDQVQSLAAKEKRKLNWDKLKIFIVPSAPPPYSYFCFSRETPYGLEEVVLTYIRGLTNPRVHPGAEFFDRYVLEIRDTAVVDLLRSGATATLKTATVVTLDELRASCTSVPTSPATRMPPELTPVEYDQTVVCGDHFVL